jgi:hypothetical protein
MRVLAAFFFARTLLMHCPRMSQFSRTTSRGSNDLQNLQPVQTERMHDLVIGLFINRYEFGRAL